MYIEPSQPRVKIQKEEKQEPRKIPWNKKFKGGLGKSLPPFLLTVGMWTYNANNIQRELYIFDYVLNNSIKSRNLHTWSYMISDIPGRQKPQQEDIEGNRKEGTSSFKKRKELASQGRESVLDTVRRKPLNSQVS